MSEVSLPLADGSGDVLIDPVRVANVRSMPAGIVAVKMNDGAVHKVAAASINDVSGALMVKRNG